MRDEDVVTAYWEHWRLLRGNRQERLAAERRPDLARQVIDEAVESGEPSAVSLLVALAEAAPSDYDAVLVGAGPLEDLLVAHGRRLARPEGVALLEEIDAAARRSRRFRQALASVWVHDEVPEEVRGRLFRFFESP